MTERPDAATGMVVLIDDTRLFRDGRPCLMARTPDHGIYLLNELAGQWIDELWLDYDLFDENSEPIVEHLIGLAAAGHPARIRQILVHSARTLEGFQITTRLRLAGYPARREFSAGIWTRNLDRRPLPHEYPRTAHT
ncbi:hypothetical protein GCM10022399_42370 [Terrabacter ginsenosidimutans]|uniref:Cyclic-phosphate processing Receiver domain-containing protein n=1 Tax=Terrabacter ginsenosidimutans TaxID=490575 RepID=A0ABP7ENJ6_9MICO